MKELPYFKFTVSEWLNGDIHFLPDNVKGVFIEICATYWFLDCSLPEATLKLRLHDKQAELDILIQHNIIKVDKEHGFIRIMFLDDQFSERITTRKALQEGGLNSVKARLSKVKASLKPAFDILDKDKEEDKDKRKDIIICVNVYRKFAHLKISIDDNKKLLGLEYSQQQIDDIYERIENYKHNTKYKSLYLTAKTWLKKEYPNVCKNKSFDVNAYQRKLIEEQNAAR